MQEYADRLRAMACELAMAEARERERVARGLHDDIGQSLALALLKLGEVGGAVSGTPSSDLVEEVRQLVVQAARATRTATFELSCPVLQQLGLQAALESLAQRMKRLYGFQVRVEGEMPVGGLSHAVGQIVFRVLRELLLNAQRHAQSSCAWLRLHCRGEHAVFVVWDHGIGFDTSPQARFSPKGGFGLYSAQAQMLSIGGRLDIDSTPGRGSRITVTVPLLPGD